MFTIHIQNIQAIGEAIIEFEDNSIVEFTGNNSNGKSVVIKMLQSVISGDIRQKSTRRALIRDGYEKGIFMITHNKVQMAILIEEDLSKSYMAYVPDVSNFDNKIVRSLSDVDGCQAIVHKFGFRTYDNNAICLQVFPTYGPIPFVTTSGSVNHDIVQDITVDKVADEFLQTFSKITFPVFKDRMKMLKHKKEVTEAKLGSLVNYDWRAYEKLGEKLRVLHADLSNYVNEVFEDIPIPYLEVYELYQFDLLDILIPEFHDEETPFDDLRTEIENLNYVSQGRCPTCKRPY